jgi:murein DD-endopeptidase MepM/ murein hydrolase activator NlpD
MASEHHTIIFVPHARARLRKWRVSTLQIKIALAAVLLLTATAGYLTWSYFTTTVNRGEISQLEGENQTLREINRSFEQSIHKLEGQLASYEDRTRQLAIVAGLEDLTVTGEEEAGVGGEPLNLDPTTGRYDLSALADRAGTLSDRLEEVGEQLEERRLKISSTPAVSPVKGILTSGFGYRRDPVHGGRAFHQGLDIAANRGYPVHATADGMVTRTGRIGGLGKAVYIAHGFGVSTRYGHLSKILVEPGQEVRRGDLIGEVGNTGRSTGYHLHYEVHVDGKPVNPLAYILDR